MTLTCPNCGNDIPIPKRMVKTIKCPFCKDKFGVEYADEEGNPPKYFWDKHPEGNRGGSADYQQSCSVDDTALG